MGEILSNDLPKMASVNNMQDELELSHVDKLVGILTSPIETFSKTASFPSKTTDWITPLLIFITASIIAIWFGFSNPAIQQEKKAESEKQIQKLVDEGTLTQEQADQQLEMTDKIMGGPIVYVTSAISIFISKFIFFFIVTGCLYFAIKLILKGDTTFKESMVAYGLPYYILTVQVMVLLILTLIFGKTINDTSVTSFLTVDKQSFLNFILSKIDVLSIWFYLVVGIGFAKMSKSENTKKYIVLVFSLWIGFSLVFFLLGKYIPFLARFNG
ncbi:MAG: hypothetical protein WCZ90_05820 [Melioribacteraceae bacterium]